MGFLYLKAVPAPLGSSALSHVISFPPKPRLTVKPAPWVTPEIEIERRRFIGHPTQENCDRFLALCRAALADYAARQ
jgi:hypothetical protein